MQNQVPKVDAATLAPVDWPVDRELEWCPPGHGDLYAALSGSGWLDALLAKGVKSLTIGGNLEFAAGVAVEGEVRLVNSFEQTARVEPGVLRDQALEFGDGAWTERN